MRNLIVCVLLLTAMMPAAAQPPLTTRTLATPFGLPVSLLSPDGRTLAVFENIVIVDSEVTPENLPIYLFDVTRGEQIGVLTGEQTDLTRGAAFSPDGTQIATSHANGELIIWDVATGAATAHYDWLPMGGSGLNYLPSGQTLIMNYNAGVISQQIVFDLNSGSITDILSLKPRTFLEFLDVTSEISLRGKLVLAAATVAPTGEIYGATQNGEVFRWDVENNVRVQLQAEFEDTPMRFNVLRFQTTLDGTLYYYDTEAEVTVQITPGGIRTEYPFGALASAVSETGLLAFTKRGDDMLYLADLTAAAPEPQPVSVDWDKFTFNSQITLAFAGDGNLILSGIIQDEGGSPILVIDLN